jgi:acyl carrier protein
MLVEANQILEYLDVDLGIQTDDIAVDTLLFSEGLIDSFALVNLMMFIEKNAGIKIDAGAVNLENFDTIERMLAYIARQQ